MVADVSLVVLGAENVRSMQGVTIQVAGDRALAAAYFTNREGSIGSDTQLGSSLGQKRGPKVIRNRSFIAHRTRVSSRRPARRLDRVSE